jgi:endoglycosylceramidase
MQSLGFNVVRLGIEWQALEPGSGWPNQPKVCTPGSPGNPHEFNLAVADRYLAHVAATVKLLSRYVIYTLLDMQQDVYSQNFRGEGAPNWAVHTDGVPIVASGGRWSSNYSNPQLDTAVHHFWTNDVVGNLQGQFDLVRATWRTTSRTTGGSSATTRTTSPSRRRHRLRSSPRSPATWSASTRGARTPGSWPTGPRRWCAPLTCRTAA